MTRPWLEPDARGAGKLCIDMLRPKKKSSTMTDEARLDVAIWCAKVAGHWGNLALGATHHD